MNERLTSILSRETEARNAAEMDRMDELADELALLDLEIGLQLAEIETSMVS